MRFVGMDESGTGKRDPPTVVGGSVVDADEQLVILGGPLQPARHHLHGTGRHGLQCLANLDRLPPTGALLFAAPLKIRNGSGSPLGVLALIAQSRQG